MMRSIPRYLGNYVKNVKYLMQHDLRELDFRKTIQLTELIMWHTQDKYRQGFSICDPVETVRLLAEHPMSFARFGDGEIDLLEGKDIPFQHYDKRLVEYYREILGEQHDNFYVGLNYLYYNDISNMNDFNRDYYLYYSPHFAKYFTRVCNKKNTFIDAGFGCVYTGLVKFDFETYYEELRNLFRNKKVVLFIGQGIDKEFKHDLFEYAQSVEYEIGPSRNSFDQFDELLERATRYDKGEYLICFILGPASKALCYELSKKGYIAWDIGHTAKAYNMFKEGKETSHENLMKFFAPD